MAKDAVIAHDVARLAELGYKQELKRAFSTFDIFGVAVSMMVLVPGIASVLFISIPNGGPVGMVWGWLVASVFISLVVIAISELASAAPTAGGLYYWTFQFASPPWRRVLSWIVGYANTIYLMTGVASVAWSIALQIAACATIATDNAWVATTAQVYGIFTAIMILQAAAASCATRIIAKMQTLVVIVNVMIFFAFIIAIAITTPKAVRNDAKFALGTFENLSGWPDGFTFCLGFLTPLWVIAGFDITVHLSEEVRNAEVAVPWANLIATAIALVGGVVVNVAIAFCMGTDLVGILADPTGQPMVAILRNSMGKTGTLIFFAAIIFVLFLTETNFTIGTSRQTFAFARDGALPFSSFMYKVNPWTGTPVNAVWVATFVGWVFGAIVFAGPAAINAIFALPIAAQYVAYVIPIGSRFIFKNDYKPGPFNMGRWSLPINVLAIVWMIFMGIVFLFPASPTLDIHTMNYACVCLGGCLILSLGWYYLPVYGGVHWFKGPINNVGLMSTETQSSSSGSLEKKDSEVREASVAVMEKES